MTRTVLIIEDNEKSLKLFKLLVTTMGHRAIATSDGADGVRLAREHVPDLILMDIQMPRLNGIEAMKLIKADPATASVPVIALTSYVMKGDRERLLAEGFAHYIPKPIDTTTFMADVQRILGSEEQHA